MIRITFKTTVEIQEALQSFEDYTNAFMSKTARDVGRNAKSDLATALLYSTPPKRSFPDEYPIQWTSDKQRKAYFASDGFGAGIPYRRTGKLAQSWEIDIGSENGLIITIQNSSRSAKFVYGTFAKQRSKAIAKQQRFHRITGWEPATDIVTPILEKARKEFLDRVNGTYVRGFRASQRAFTGRGGT